MTVMLGILEPMCQLEEVLQIGATPDEDESSHMVYGHHREESAVLVANAAADDVNYSCSSRPLRQFGSPELYSLLGKSLSH